MVLTNKSRRRRGLKNRWRGRGGQDRSVCGHETKRQRQQSQSPTATLGNKTNNQGWNERDRQDLLGYFQAYQHGAKRVYSLLGLIVSPFSLSLSSSSSVRIGSVDLPALTRDVLEQPRLVLPPSLTPKQRKMVHECCAECDLFHYTFEEEGNNKGEENENNKTRVVVVSPYADGFTDLVVQQPTNTTAIITPVYKFVSWYARTDPNQALHVEALARKRIQELLDQPGNCLRGGEQDDDDHRHHPSYYSLDSIDYVAMEGKNLANSNINNTDNWMLVDTPEKVDLCVAELSAATEIGFDLECYNKSRVAQLTCLLQLVASDTGKEYVIDTLASQELWDRVSLQLRIIFEDAKVVKVGHSIASLDVRCLHRDFGIFVVNAFDTYEAARALKLPAHGLAAVCQHYGLEENLSHHYRQLKDVYQKCDWRQRPLTEAMLEYSRFDVRYLLQLRRLMMRDLTRAELYDRRMEQLEDVAKALKAVVGQEGEQEESNYNSNKMNSSSTTDIISRQLLDQQDKSCASSLRETFSAQQSIESVEQGYFTAVSSQSESVLGSLDNDDNDDIDDEFAPPNNNNESSSNDPSAKRHVQVLSPTVVASAAMLRQDPRLMKVISLSQVRCQALWGAPQQQKQYSSLQNLLLDLWFCRHEKDRDDSSVQLYLELVKWRASVARELGCLEEFVSPLEFLVEVAWRKPTSVLALRRISWHLPDALEDHEIYQRQVLEIVSTKYNKRKYHGGDGGILFVSQQKARLQNRKKIMMISAAAAATGFALFMFASSRRVKRL